MERCKRDHPPSLWFLSSSPLHPLEVGENSVMADQDIKGNGMRFGLQYLNSFVLQEKFL